MKDEIKKVYLSRGGSGGYTARVTLKLSWLRDMLEKYHLEKDDIKVKLMYDEENKQIIIKKLTNE